MTPEILAWLKSSSYMFPENPSVLELGSYDVNGSARSSIAHKQWVGMDIVEGPGVDVVVHEQEVYRLYLRGASYMPNLFVCCECLEHVRDPIATVNEFKLAMKESIDMRRENGVPGHLKSTLVITSPTYGFPYHAYPKDYWRFTADTLVDVLFDGLTPTYVGHLNSNEGPNTTVCGIAILE